MVVMVNCIYSRLSYNLNNSVKSFLFFFTLFILILSGCAPVMSKDVLAKVDRGIIFRDIINDPEQFTGRTVLVGGSIVNVENFKEQTILEVLQQPLNRSLRPVNAENSLGRFLVIFPGFRDPVVYSPGKLITVVGVVKGAEVRNLGQMPYTYPVISPQDHYLWGPYRGTGISIGLGVIGSF